LNSSLGVECERSPEDHRIRLLQRLRRQVQEDARAFSFAIDDGPNRADDACKYDLDKDALSKIDPRLATYLLAGELLFWQDYGRALRDMSTLRAAMGTRSTAEEIRLLSTNSQMISGVCAALREQGDPPGADAFYAVANGSLAVDAFLSRTLKHPRLSLHEEVLTSLGLANRAVAFELGYLDESLDLLCERGSQDGSSLAKGVATAIAENRSRLQLNGTVPTASETAPCQPMSAGREMPRGVSELLQAYTLLGELAALREASGPAQATYFDEKMRAAPFLLLRPSERRKFSEFVSGRATLAAFYSETFGASDLRYHAELAAALTENAL
jgi:hypothetical protein